MTNKNLNISPYYDDYNSLKSFYQILFRPGESVQARELTQIQSILQNQIENFGSHIFKNGSLVVGAQITLNHNASFLKIKSTHNGESEINGGILVNVLNFVGKKINIFNAEGTTQIARASVILSQGTDTLIISEIFGDFNSIPGNAQIRIEGSIGTQDAETLPTAFFGKATLASINDGIFFVDGIFCIIKSQTIVVDYTNLASKKIGIRTNYIIINDSMDSSLLDPAAGFSNYASPGADRLKLELLLETREITSPENLINFHELMRIENGEVLKQVVYPQYSELEKTLARRTHDESGHYTVKPFVAQAENHFKGTGTITINAGIVTGVGTLFSEELSSGCIIETQDNKQFVVVSSTENNTHVSVTPSAGPESFVTVPSRFFVRNGKKLNIKLSPGKSYVKGFEFETIAPNNIQINKARKIVDNPRHDFSVSYGNFVICNAMNASFNFSEFENVQLLDYTNTVIGSANIRMIDHDGTLYRVFLFNIKMNAGRFFETIRRITKFGSTAQTATIDIDGRGSIQSIGTGNVIVSGTTVSGNQTNFLTELKAGSRIVINNIAYNVVTVASDTSLTISSSATVTIPTSFLIRDTQIFESDRAEWVVPIGFNVLSPTTSDGVTPTFTNTGYFLRNHRTVSGGGPGVTTLQFSIPAPYEYLPGIINYQLIQIGATLAHSSTDLTSQITNVSVTNTIGSSTVTVHRATDFPIATYALYATVKAESPEPRTKTYRQFSNNIQLNDTVSLGRRFVSLYNFALNNFVLSLRKADVTNIEKVYLNPVVTNGVVTGGEDVTHMFSFNTGQRDEFYDHASITLNSRFRDMFPVGNILVLFNFWEHSRSIGLITTRSYNDYNIIPTYYSSTSGKTFVLRDCVDYRPSLPDNAVISPEGVFPSAMFVSFFSEFPQNNSNFEANVSYFLSRKDRLLITKDGRFKVLEGLSELNSKLPQIIDDSMLIYNISLNPYTYTEFDLNLQFVENKRYTMRDIGKIEERLDALEYYTSLSLIEKETADLLVRDGSGNLRFKNGFIVDNFTGHKIGDVNRLDYSCSIDFEKNHLRSKFKTRNFKLEHTNNTISTESTSNKPVKKGNLLLIPYTDNFRFVSQLQASGFVNVNPYSVFSWIGQLRLEPNSDIWIETTARPDLIVNIDNGLDNILSNNFEGTRWNDWETTWTGFEVQSRREEINEQNLTHPIFLGWLDRGPTWSRRILTRRNITETGVNVTEAVRTGIRTTINSSLTEESLGQRIVDVSVIPFMRNISIGLSATSLKPNTKVFIFFDDVNVTSLVSGSLPYVIGTGDLRTDSIGSFIGTLNIPNPNDSTTHRFRTGTKTIRITDNSLNEVFTSTTMAEAIFSSSGTMNTTEETIARIRNFEIQNQNVSETQRVVSDPITRETTAETSRTITWIDPIAQSFLVDGTVFREGVFLSKVRLFFRSKDANLPVTVQIRPTVNGYPHSSFVMPLGSKTVFPNQINVPPTILNSNNAEILNFGTMVEFDSPVYLQPGEYTIVLLSNSNEYEVYTGEIGQRRLGSTEVISEQPYAGSFFKSQNASTWTAEQNMDLMFELYICEFTTNTNIFAEFVENKPYIDNTIINVFKIGDTSQTFPSCSLSHSYISKNTFETYFALIDRFRDISPNNNMILTRENEINPTGENFRYRSIMRTRNRFVSPIIDTERTNLITVENLINNSTDVVSFTHGTTDGPTFNIGLNQTIQSNTGIIDNFELIKHTFNASDSNVVNVANDSITISNHGFITGNRIIYSTGGGTVIGGLTNSVTYFIIKVNDNSFRLATTIDNAVSGTAINLTGVGVGTNHIIVSVDGKIFLKKTSPGDFLIGQTFTSNGNGVSCTISQINSETDPEFGGASTRYITRIINLKRNNDYIKTYITAYKPAGSDIKIFYKAVQSDNSNIINNIPYKELIQEEPNINIFSNSENDLIEYVFSPRELTSVGEFNRIVIKIVLLTNDRCNTPFLKNMRTVILDME